MLAGWLLLLLCESSLTYFVFLWALRWCFKEEIKWFKHHERLKINNWLLSLLLRSSHELSCNLRCFPLSIVHISLRQAQIRRVEKQKDSEWVSESNNQQHMMEWIKNTTSELLVWPSINLLKLLWSWRPHDRRWWNVASFTHPPRVFLYSSCSDASLNFTRSLTDRLKKINIASNLPKLHPEANFSIFCRHCRLSCSSRQRSRRISL